MTSNEGSIEKHPVERKQIPVRISKELMDQIDKAINEDGFFTTRTDFVMAAVREYFKFNIKTLTKIQEDFSKNQSTDIEDWKNKISPLMISSSYIKRLDSDMKSAFKFPLEPQGNNGGAITASIPKGLYHRLLSYINSVDVFDNTAHFVKSAILFSLHNHCVMVRNLDKLESEDKPSVSDGYYKKFLSFA